MRKWNMGTSKYSVFKRDRARSRCARRASRSAGSAGDDLRKQVLEATELDARCNEANPLRFGE
jgi:hypothetical protein